MAGSSAVAEQGLDLRARQRRGVAVPGHVDAVPAEPRDAGAGRGLGGRGVHPQGELGVVRDRDPFARDGIDPLVRLRDGRPEGAQGLHLDARGVARLRLAEGQGVDADGGRGADRDRRRPDRHRRPGVGRCRAAQPHVAAMAGEAAGGEHDEDRHAPHRSGSPGRRRTGRAPPCQRPSRRSRVSIASRTAPWPPASEHDEGGGRQTSGAASSGAAAKPAARMGGRSERSSPTKAPSARRETARRAQGAAGLPPPCRSRPGPPRGCPAPGRGVRRPVARRPVTIAGTIPARWRRWTPMPSRAWNDFHSPPGLVVRDRPVGQGAVDVHHEEADPGGSRGRLRGGACGGRGHGGRGRRGRRAPHSPAIVGRGRAPMPSGTAAGIAGGPPVGYLTPDGLDPLPSSSALGAFALLPLGPRERPRLDGQPPGRPHRRRRGAHHPQPDRPPRPHRVDPPADRAPVGDRTVPIVFGYAKPVPYNRSGFRNPFLGSAAVAGAGPVCNFLLATLSAVLLGLVPVDGRIEGTPGPRRPHPDGAS